MSDKTQALGQILLAYVIGLLAAASTLVLVPLPQPWNALLADVIATGVIFGFSFTYRNSSFYDPYWSVIPPLLAVYWWLASADIQVNAARATLVVALVWLWGIRLTANWATYWGGLRHEDWRYPLVRARAGRAGYVVDFLGIHLFPTLQVFAASLPVYAVMTRGQAPLGVLDGLAAVVTLAAIVIETMADLQLHAFIARRRGGECIQSGLWAWSRHPNYFGELSFWWGLMLFGLAADASQWWWVAPGALAMSLMFAFVSIPFMDQRSLQRRPDYAELMGRIPALLPWPPRR